MANQEERRDVLGSIRPVRRSDARMQDSLLGIKVMALEIQHFRGITGSLRVSFSGRDEKPTSLLILGDNGTGKSSIVDALEFALRGRVSRRGNAGIKVKREARDLLHPGSHPTVTVTMGQKQYLRGRPIEGSAAKRLGRDLAPGFELAPLAISRADIDVFWRIDSRERMRFFFDYLRLQSNHSGYHALESERLAAALASTEIAVLKGQITLAAAADVPVASIPVSDRVTFYQWRARQWPAYNSATGSTPRGASSPERIAAIRNLPGHIQRANLELARALEAMHGLQERLNGAIVAAGGEPGELPPVLASELPELLNEISVDVTTAFLDIAKLPHITGVAIQLGEKDRELKVECALASGSVVDPRQILSEGNLDLLALLLMLEVARACVRRGQAPVLVLDDVWQSVDTIHRTAVLGHLFEGNFKNWQLIITAHDRLWARLIEEKARRQSFALKTLRVSAWSPEGGPTVRQGYFGTPAQLKQQIERSEPDVLVGYVGKALEELADLLSASLRVSVARAEGDRYTLEALWPPVHKALNGSMLPSAITNPASEINDLYVLRNTAGAHFNLWALTLSETEAQAFARNVLALWIATHCPTCGAPLAITGIPSGPKYSYRCKHGGP